MRKLDSLTSRRGRGHTIHEIRQPIGMRCAVKLPDIHDVVLIFQNSSFVIVDIKIIRSRKDGHYSRELGCASFAVHAIAMTRKLVE